MDAKTLLNKFIRLRNLSFSIIVCVMILFYVCLTDKLVFQNKYRTRNTALETLPNLSIKATLKPSFALEKVFTKDIDEAEKMSDKRLLHKRANSAITLHFNKPMNAHGDVDNLQTSFPTDLTTSDDHQVETYINSNDKRNSGSLKGRVNDSHWFAGEEKGIVRLDHTKHNPGSVLQERQSNKYHGTDLMAMVSVFIQISYMYMWKKSFPRLPRKKRKLGVQRLSRNVSSAKFQERWQRHSVYVHLFNGYLFIDYLDSQGTSG